MKFKHLFAPGKIGNRYTKNRIVMSPMGENMANEDGSLSEQAFAYYLERAKGGAGIIIPGVLSVDYPTGKTTGCQHRLDDPKYVAGWYKLANAIHHEGALLIPQIHHAGAQTNCITAEGRTPVCVSDTDEVEHAFIKYYRTYGPQHELTTEEVKELIQKFIQTGIYAQFAQCDGVEIHAAHGYLISQFLSPDTNKRTDEFGGQLNIACVPPRKFPIEYEIDNLKRELKRYNVDVRLGVEATPKTIKEFAPDAVIVATGSVPATPPIKGVENATQSWNILDGSTKLPKNQNVVMIGGGIVASVNIT